MTQTQLIWTLAGLLMIAIVVVFLLLYEKHRYVFTTETPDEIEDECQNMVSVICNELIREWNLQPTIMENLHKEQDTPIYTSFTMPGLPFEGHADFCMVWRRYVVVRITTRNGDKIIARQKKFRLRNNTIPLDSLIKFYDKAYEKALPPIIDLIPYVRGAHVICDKMPPEMINEMLFKYVITFNPDTHKKELKD